MMPEHIDLEIEDHSKCDEFIEAPDIASELCLKTYTVNHVLERLRKSGVVKKYSMTDKRQNCIERKYGEPIESILYRMHHDEEKTVKEMSNILGVARKSLTVWMDSFGISHRTISEDNHRRYKHMTEEEKKLQTVVANEVVRSLPYTPRPERWGAHRFVPSGKEAPNWKGGQVVCVCEYCGKFFERPKSALKEEYTMVTCSKECHNNLVGRRFSGANHPNWKGGKDCYRGVNWPKVANAVRARDGNKCVLCGLTDYENINLYGGSLNVHHKQPYRITHDSSDENLISLCTKCHMNMEYLFYSENVFYETDMFSE